MKHGILVTHGEIGRALIDAAERIVGKQEFLQTLSVQKLSVKDIYERLKAMVSGPAKEDDVIIMASLRGGSCWNVSVAVAKEFPRIKVVSGVNLPMVLSFLTKREHFNGEELVEILHQDAIRGVAVNED